MTAFRCTAKLLNAMKDLPGTDPAPASNRLGEWMTTRGGSDAASWWCQ